MSFITAAGHEYSAYGTGIFGSQPEAPIDPPLSAPEDSRMSGMPAEPPRAPRILAFFNEIAALATRTMRDLKATLKGLENRVISSFLYKTACKKSIESLARAFASNDIKAISKQFEKFCRFRNVQRAFLKEHPESAKRLEETYRRDVKKFIKPFAKDLKKGLAQIAAWERTTDIPRSERRDARFIRAMVTLLLDYAEAAPSE